MAGKIKMTIDQIIEKKSNGNTVIAKSTKTKLILRGINVDNYTASSSDDVAVLDKLKKAAEDFGLTIKI